MSVGRDAPTGAGIGAAVPHIVLESAKGQTNTMVAPRLHLSRATVGKWRQRFVEQWTPTVFTTGPDRGATFGVMKTSEGSW